MENPYLSFLPHELFTPNPCVFLRCSYFWYPQYDEQDKGLLNKLISSNEQVVLNLIHKEYVVDNETVDGVTTLSGLFPPFDPRDMPKVNEFYALVNRLVHEHEVTPKQQRTIISQHKKDWYKKTVMSEKKQALTYNELYIPVPKSIFEFSARYLTLMNRDHKEYLNNTRNAVDLCFKSFEKQADTRSTSSVPTKRLIHLVTTSLIAN